VQRKLAVDISSESKDSASVPDRKWVSYRHNAQHQPHQTAAFSEPYPHQSERQWGQKRPRQPTHQRRAKRRCWCIRFSASVVGRP